MMGKLILVLIVAQNIDCTVIRQTVSFIEQSVAFILDTWAPLPLDGVSPSVFRCTSTPMETGPIGTCVET